MKITSLEEYEQWTTRELDNLLRPVKSKAAKLLDDNVKVVNEASLFFQNLSTKAEREMATKKDAASYRAARIIGHGANQGLDLVKKIEPNREISWDNLKILKDNLSTSVRTLRDVRSRTAAELSGFYILDMRSFSGMVERLAKNGERLATFLEGEGSNLQKARTIQGIIESMKNARTELIEKQREVDRLQQAKTRQELMIDELTGDTDKLSKNQELSEVLAIEKELRKESRKFRSETLAHLQRPIRRLREISDRGDFPIDSEKREAMKDYLRSPYKSFLSPTKGQYLKPILENMKQALDTGKMEFKARKAQRISNQLKQLVSTKQLDDMQLHGRILVEKRRELLKNLPVRNAYKERKQLLEHIDSSKQDLGSIMAKLAIAKENVKTASERLAHLMQLAETKTREYMRRDVQLDTSIDMIAT